MALGRRRQDLLVCYRCSRRRIQIEPLHQNGRNGDDPEAGRRVHVQNGGSVQRRRRARRRRRRNGGVRRKHAAFHRPSRYSLGHGRSERGFAARRFESARTGYAQGRRHRNAERSRNFGRRLAFRSPGSRRGQGGHGHRRFRSGCVRAGPRRESSGRLIPGGQSAVRAPLESDRHRA